MIYLISHITKIAQNVNRTYICLNLAKHTKTIGGDTWLDDPKITPMGY